MDVHDIEDHVARVGGVLITDRRNVYDRVEKPYVMPKVAQRRVDLELWAIEESQERTGLRTRWVSSQAMLANSLTKQGKTSSWDALFSWARCGGSLKIRICFPGATGWEKPFWNESWNLTRKYPFPNSAQRGCTNPGMQVSRTTP